MENQCRLLLQGFHTSQQPVTKLWSPFSGKPRSLDHSVAVSCVIPNCNRSFQPLVFSWLMIAQWLDDSSARLLPSCVERRSLHQPVPICTCGPPSGRPVGHFQGIALLRLLQDDNASMRILKCTDPTYQLPEGLMFSSKGLQDVFPFAHPLP